jgi:hypothetical protein
MDRLNKATIEMERGSHENATIIYFFLRYFFSCLKINTKKMRTRSRSYSRRRSRRQSSYLKFMKKELKKEGGGPAAMKKAAKKWRSHH